MNSSPRFLFVLIFAALFVSAADLSRAGEAPAAFRGERALRSWTDVRATDEGERLVRIEMLFDYDQGISIERLFDLETGDLIRSAPAGTTPTCSTEELEQARAVVLADDDFHRTILEKNAILEGGFILTESEGKACGPGSRCLQIWGFERDNTATALFCAVVDLTENRVVYPDYWRMEGEYR